jgi:flagellar protein FliL
MAAPAKTEAPAAKSPKGEVAEPVPVAVPVAAPSAGIKAWVPALLALVLAPALTWATVEFVLVPRLQKKLAAGPAPAADAAAEHGHAPAPSAPAHGGKAGKEGASKEGGPSFEFQNVVVNLAGTMGTRYLKTSFLITGADVNIRSIFESARPKLTDVTLNVLSSLTLADLEEPGAKNVIREKLVAAYNQALGRKVADQVYFSDFVIQ